MNFAEDGGNFFGLDGGNRVNEQGHGAVIRQILQALLWKIGVGHHHLGVLQQRKLRRQVSRGDFFADFHVGHGQCHLAVLIGQVQIGGGRTPGHPQGVAQVDAQLGTGGRHPLAVDIVAIGAEQMNIRPQQRQVMGNVPTHAAQADGHGAGV